MEEYTPKFKKDLVEYLKKEIAAREYCRVYSDFKNCPYYQKDKIKACKNCADKITLINNKII